MRIGIPEIIIILVIIIVIILIARISRARPGAAEQDTESSRGVPHGQGKGRGSKPRSYLRKLGISLTLIGVILALAGISMFRWALQSYIWAFAIIAAGFIAVFLSRRK